ncbi:MAG: DUF3501 family protein [Burkholderiaceae bacterium]
MALITRDSLLTLEAYAKARPDFRAKVMAHKRNRKLSIGQNVTLIFEDELTVRYQIQEMLRIEKTFEEAGIQDELDAYNPLVPTGREFKATMMIEYPDPDERRGALARLKGVERRTWVQVAGMSRVYAVADEDLERENEEKTSSVHFLRFELGDDMAVALKNGASLSAGIDHDAYRIDVSPVPTAIRDSLVGDLT